MTGGCIQRQEIVSADRHRETVSKCANERIAKREAVLVHRQLAEAFLGTICRRRRLGHELGTSKEPTGRRDDALGRNLKTRQPAISIRPDLDDEIVTAANSHFGPG
jgi:hypothetical protein